MSEDAASPRLTPGQRLALLEALLDRIPDFFYVHDSRLTFQYANRAAAEYFGRPKEEMPGLRHRDVDDDEEQAAFFEAELIPIIERGEPVTTGDLPYQRRDGSRGLLRAHIVPFDDPSSGERMMLGISRDVTEERQAGVERETRAAYERELEIARRVQRSLLPNSIPALNGFDMAARCDPAHFAGGDFYDFIECSDGRVLVLVGDVTGHGVGPALIAASCRAYARALLPSARLETAMAQLDRHVSSDGAEGTFVTLAAIELAPARPVVRYCSAGHGPVVHISGGTHTVLPTQCPPLGLGVADDAELSAMELELAPDEVLLLPSDGLVESHSPDGRQRGAGGLISAAAGGTAAQIVSSCFEADARWRDGDPASDDQTLVVVRRV